MKIIKNCIMCKGSGKVTNAHGTFICPECEIRELFDKAKEMVEDKIYVFDQERREEMEHIAKLFPRPTICHDWHIDIFKENKIRRVDYSWMNKQISF